MASSDSPEGRSFENSIERHSEGGEYGETHGEGHLDLFECEGEFFEKDLYPPGMDEFKDSSEGQQCEEEDSELFKSDSGISGEGEKQDESMLDSMESQLVLRTSSSSKEMIPLKEQSGYQNIIRIFRKILNDLVSKTPDNVLDYFGEYARRVLEDRVETYGVPFELFYPTALIYMSNITSFHLDFKDAIDEYLHMYGIELPGEMNKPEESNMKEIELGGESELGEVEVAPPRIIGDDDWEEGGYKHYLDRKAEPKEPPFDEFAHVQLEQLQFFDEVGIGLPRYEQYEVHMAMLRLAKVRNLIDVKFWGKIFGIYQDYYVAEAEMKLEDMKIEDFEDVPDYPESEFADELEEYLEEVCEEFGGEEDKETGTQQDELSGEYDRNMFTEYYGEYGGEDYAKQILISMKRSEEKIPVTPEIDQLQPFELMGEMVGERGETESVFELPVSDGKFKGKLTLKNYKLPPMPVIKEKKVKITPAEDPGEGVNKHVFFVSNDPKSDWIRLPHVTPEQIVVARQIKKFFTGYLSSRVISFPRFPGLEMHLLRAQIARISAGSQVSPAGYYRFDEGEEAADAFDVAAGKGGKILLNREFDPLTVKDLTDPTCAFWVHHTSHILQQGRTVWFNVDQKKNVGAGEGMEDDGEEAPPFAEAVGERGPPLLTSCAEDLFMDEIPPWTVRPAIELAPHEGVVFIRSNLWPGAYNFAFGKKIGFMYIGWGMKALSYGFTPVGVPPAQKEYQNRPTIMEITDPTPEQEEEYMKRLEEWLKSKEKKPPMMEGDGGEEGEGADDADDDDD